MPMEGGGSEASEPPSIRPLNKGVVHRICAGQVILDLSSAVKELVENSLDAGATSIEVALKEYGLESFQVIDNGSGISPKNFRVLALKHHTSKLNGFQDLESLTTFGFRGEALSSLCALGDLTIETRTSSEVVATHLTYDRSGLLTAERKTARQAGTTVTVKKLFSYLPVRSKEFQRNIRKEYGKLIGLLNAYALVAKGVRLICTNTTGKNARSVVLKTQGGGSLKDNIITVFGMSTFSSLEPVRVSITDDCMVEGFVSKSGYGSGRHIGDRQFFFANGRPVDVPKVGKLVNEVYRGANSRQYPVVILDFSIPTRAYDVNVTPDKRKIYFSNESTILQSLRETLEKIYSSNQVTYTVNTVEELNEENLASKVDSLSESSEMPIKQLFQDDNVVREENDDKQCTNGSAAFTTVKGNRIDSSAEELGTGVHAVKKQFMLRVHGDKKSQHINAVQSRLILKGGTDNSLQQSKIIQTSLSNFVTVNKRKLENMDTALSEVPLLRSGPLDRLRDNRSVNHSSSLRSPVNSKKYDDYKNSTCSEAQPAKTPRVVSFFDDAEPNVSLCSSNKEQSGTREAMDLPEQIIEERASSDAGVPSALRSTNSQPAHVDLPPHSLGKDSPTVSSGINVGFTLQFSVKDLMSRRKQRLSRLQSISHSSGRMNLKGGFAAATLEHSQFANEEGKAKALAAATRELDRLFKKGDFNHMKVIGQFNLGFIIGKLDQDLFIVDQHAADEKYNYERLSLTTILNQQPLFRPLLMELSPEEEIVISMHMDTFRKNGFLLEEDMHAPPGNRFKLKAVPFSKNITFGVAVSQMSRSLYLFYPIVMENAP
ncbi:DNA mismatch repair protein PMS1 isoform X2 [Henckelia pumila]|uniref:DNA mismatch repair protein PMS1 isoform X2 n=1 Tax=Henckelia pumila TaxID=405737 RepID=UPI003C6DDD54